MHSQLPTITPEELTQIRDAVTAVQAVGHAPSLEEVVEQLALPAQNDNTSLPEHVSTKLMILRSAAKDISDFVDTHGEEIDTFAVNIKTVSEIFGETARNVVAAPWLEKCDEGADERHRLNRSFDKAWEALKSAVREHCSKEPNYRALLDEIVEQNKHINDGLRTVMKDHFSQDTIRRIAPTARSYEGKLFHFAKKLAAQEDFQKLVVEDMERHTVTGEQEELQDVACFTAGLTILLPAIVLFTPSPSEEIRSFVTTLQSAAQQLESDAQERAQTQAKRESGRAQKSAAALVTKFQQSPEGAVLAKSGFLAPPTSLLPEANLRSLSSFSVAQITQAEERLAASNFPSPTDRAVSSQYLDEVRNWLERRGVQEANYEAVAHEHSLDELKAQEGKFIARFCPDSEDRDPGPFLPEDIREVIKKSPRFFLISEEEREQFGEDLFAFHSMVEEGPEELRESYSIIGFPADVSVENLPQQMRDYDASAKIIYLPDSLEWDPEVELAKVDHREVRNRLKAFEQTIDENLTDYGQRLIQRSPEILILEGEKLSQYTSALNEALLEELTDPTPGAPDPETSIESYLPGGIEQVLLLRGCAKYGATLPEDPCSREEAQQRHIAVYGELNHLHFLDDTEKTELVTELIRAHPDIFFASSPHSLEKFGADGQNRFEGYIRAVRGSLKGATARPAVTLLRQLNPELISLSGP